MKVDCSVLIACKDKESTLDECVQSVLQQSMKPKEIIIYHDGCKEPMAHALAVSIIANENKGVAFARDKMFHYSTGKFVLFVDGDDKLSPDYIEKMMRLDTDIAYPDVFLWKNHGNVVGEDTLHITPHTITPKMMMDIKNWIPVTCLMKREVYERVGGFPALKVYEDLQFWMEAMLDDFKFKKAHTLLWYRQSGDTRNRQNIDLRRVVYKKIMDRYELKGNKLCEISTQQ